MPPKQSASERLSFANGALVLLAADSPTRFPFDFELCYCCKFVDSTADRPNASEPASEESGEQPLDSLLLETAAVELNGYLRALLHSFRAHDHSALVLLRLSSTFFFFCCLTFVVFESGTTGSRTNQAASFPTPAATA